MNDIKKLNHASIAIPTYNSSKYVKDCLSRLKKLKLVNEIVINDDCSKIEEFQILENEILKFKNNSNIKIKLFRNENNFGAFKNKYLNIERCSNNLVYQIDSDNVPQKNLDLIINKINDVNNKNNLYFPSRIYQFKNNYKIARSMSLFSKKYKVKFFNDDYLFDIADAVNYYKKNVNITIDKHVGWILNLGNFFTFRETYLRTMSTHINTDEHPLSADALTISYIWLLNGGKINLLKDFHHLHRKRDDSVSVTEGEGTGMAYEYYKNKYIEI